jgi:hypothetical protein
MKTVSICSVAASILLSVAVALPQCTTARDKEPKMLFKLVDQADIKMTEKQQRIFDRLKKSPATQSVVVLSLQPKTLDVLGAPLRLPLGAGKNLDLVKYSVTKADRSTVLAWGDKSTLSISGEFVSGLIFADDGVFELRPLGDGLHALARLDQTKFKDEPKEKK